MSESGIAHGSLFVHAQLALLMETGVCALERQCSHATLIGDVQQSRSDCRRGDAAGREKLADELGRLVLVEVESGAVLADTAPAQEIPPDRLIHLLQQAVAYQMEFQRYHPLLVPQVKRTAALCHLGPRQGGQCKEATHVQINRDLLVLHAPAAAMDRLRLLLVRCTRQCTAGAAWTACV